MALHDAHCKSVGLDEPFDAPDRRIEYWTTLAEAAIRAAIGCAEVVGDNTTGEDEVFWGKSGSTHTIRPGDTILILRADAGEGEQ